MAKKILRRYRNKGGRPKMNFTEPVYFRVTSIMKKLIMEAAVKKQTSISDFIRWCIVDGVMK